MKPASSGQPPFSTGYPVSPQGLPPSVPTERRYRLDFARTAAELEAVQRLRFEVFNLEMGEGFDESHETGLDQDRFDSVCHHLMIIDRKTEAVVGTYRMQTGEMALLNRGFYTADEFDLKSLSDDVRLNSVETGRACVAREYRNHRVLFMLWRGLVAYMAHNRKRYVFGCCSLTSQDPVLGKQAMEHLIQQGHVRDDVSVTPLAGWECYPAGFSLTDAQRAKTIKLPRLFRTYLRYGAKVCGTPALDRFFKTIDYLVIMDLNELDPISRRMLYG
jgi:putative hemolysin